MFDLIAFVKARRPMISQKTETELHKIQFLAEQFCRSDLIPIVLAEVDINSENALKELKKEFLGTARNEHVWALGSKDDFDSDVHQRNSDFYRTLADAMQIIIDDIQKGN